MSSAYDQHYQYTDQGQLLLNTSQYEAYNAQRSKSRTPTSLINHPSQSPGPPLSTPPHSRNTSQPPPEQFPESMYWEDEHASPSDSPTSLQTPDNETLDQMEMPHSESIGNFYPQHHEVLVSTQMQHDPLPAMAPMYYLSEQAIHNAITAVVASQTQQYQTPFNVQNQQPQNILASTTVSQPYNQFFGQPYTNQPSHRDPWTSQRPQLSPEVPRAGGVIFDPETDPMDYSPYVNSDVGNWTNHNTDPTQLVSPNEPLGPQDNPFTFSTPRQHHHFNQRPLQMRVTVPSPPPGPHSFVHYDPLSAFSNSYSPSSPDTSTMGSSIGQLPQSPYQADISPQASMPSPGGSDGIFSSYQHSTPDMVMSDAYMSDQYDAKPDPAAPSVYTEPTSEMTIRVSDSAIREMTFEASPEPDGHSRSQGSTRGLGSRAGGRQLGTHLEPKVAKAAHDMRKIVACWHCVLQRDKCGPGDTCDRCLKRAQRPNADCGLGCSRVKLIELAEYFLPTLVTQMHEDAFLTHFVSQHIRSWGNVEITIYMTCGQKKMPRIPVKVYEFVPLDNELLVQIQYNTNKVTHERVAVQKQSPALGMVQITPNEEKKYDKYINDIVDNHLDAFGELCWMEDDNDFQQKLFKLMTRVKPKSEDEAKLLREVFRLVICTYIMSHTLTIADESKYETLSKMHSYNPSQTPLQNFTSPRMTNRQLKYFFCRLQRSILSTVLNKLQQIFKSSKGCDKWLAAFVAIVGMCMAHEDQQATIHLVMETKARTEGMDMRSLQERADIACREIDLRMGFINSIFRWKYNRKCNPLRDADQAWDREAGFGDENSVNFVRAVSQLVKDNMNYLQQRGDVSISAANQTKYSSRLVGRFLLSFWLPQT